MRTLLLSAVALATALSTPLAAQVIPVLPPTIVPIAGQQTSLSTSSPTRLIAQNIALSQGQMLHVFAREEFTSSVGTTEGSIDYVDVWVECLDPSRQLAPGTLDSGQNFVAGRGPGPNYPTKGHLVLTPSTLITAKSSGIYTCQLVSGVSKPGWAVGRLNQGENTTWLGLSAPIDLNDAFSWGGFGSCPWKGPYTGSDGCLYLGTGPGSHGAPHVDPFSAQGASTANWFPAAGIAFVDVTATLQVTLCGHTSSCVKEFRSNDTSSVTVDSYFEMDQVDSSGTPSHTVVSPTQRTTIDNLTHHDMIFHTLSTVPVYPSPSPPQLRAKLVVTWVSGSTAKIDGAEAVAYMTYRGQGQAVPNALGVSESVAKSRLTAAGLVPHAILAKECIDPGNVTLESPAGETLVLPGSGVNITVDTAQKGTCIPR